MGLVWRACRLLVRSMLVQSMRLPDSGRITLVLNQPVTRSAVLFLIGCVISQTFRLAERDWLVGQLAALIQTAMRTMLGIDVAQARCKLCDGDTVILVGGPLIAMEIDSAKDIAFHGRPWHCKLLNV